MKFGAEFRRDKNDNSIQGGARPLYSFVRLWNLANDTPIFESINASPVTGTPAEGAFQIAVTTTLSMFRMIGSFGRT